MQVRVVFFSDVLITQECPQAGVKARIPENIFLIKFTGCNAFKIQSKKKQTKKLSFHLNTDLTPIG